MLGKTRVWTAVSLLIMMLAALVATLTMEGCGLDEWKSATLPEARLRFAVPANWKVNLRRPGQSNTDKNVLSGPSETGDGAVLTALPVMEDAALILIATEKTASPDLFARRVEDFIPLKGVRFTTPMQAYSLNGLHGFAGEGYGRLPSDGTDVYFRCMVLDVEGKPVIATLYAEESQKERYSPIFDTIVARIHPTSGTSMAAPAASSQVASIDIDPTSPMTKGALKAFSKRVKAWAHRVGTSPEEALEGT